MDSNDSSRERQDNQAGKPLRVAVTGGSGRIGSQVVKALVHRGHDVLNIDNREPSNSPSRFASADLRDRSQIQPLLEELDAVIHLGEIPDQYQSIPPNEIFAHNTAATSTVLQLAADLKLKRAIYTSTCQVYGCWDEPNVPPIHLPMDETHPVQPQNVYALSKVANESYAAMLGRHAGLSIAVVRLPWVLGHQFPGNWFRDMENPDFKVDGMKTCIHISDVVDFYIKAIEHPRPGCETYHLCADDVFTTSPIRELLARKRPEYPPLPQNWPPFKSPVLTGKAREHFGWEANWSIQQAYRDWNLHESATS